MEKLLKYSKFKKALFGWHSFIFVELEDGMGADIDIENRAIELRPLADLRVYKILSTGEIQKPTEEAIEKAKEVLDKLTQLANIDNNASDEEKTLLERFF